MGAATDAYREAIAEVAGAAGLPREEALSMVTVPRERERADLTLPCFRWAKSLKRAPDAIARDVAAAFEGGELLACAEAVGPFVNFRIHRPAFVASVLDGIDENHGRSSEGEGQAVVIDYGSPNIAKPLLFHHLRSAVIGQALCNLHRWHGYTVVGINFLGDVGTAFGKLSVGLEQRRREAGTATADTVWDQSPPPAGESSAPHCDPAELTPERLQEAYVVGSGVCGTYPERMDEARAWAKRLEDDDAEATRLWEQSRRVSLEGFRKVYELLGIEHTVIDGEQMYVARAQKRVEELLESGQAEISEGAAVIRTDEGVLLLRKSDGATLYSTRDLVAAEDRFARFQFAHSLYVVDIAQEHHFKLLFASLEAIGHDWADRCRHVAFGQVLMGGRRTATREGRGILLDDVLREGIARARKIIEEKNADLADKDTVARAVGVGAVTFSDVGYPVRKDIHFDWNEILSFDGRTGPYLQYVHASACSILRKGGAPSAADLARLTDEHEWELVRRLFEFPGAVAKARDECEPSLVANYLYDLAREFRAYHTAGSRDAALRVLADDAPLRGARLRLVQGVRHTLAIGLRLLGIEPLEEM